MSLEINGKLYLTTAEVAQKLGVTPGRVRQLIMDKRLTDILQFSNRTLVSAAEVEAYQQHRNEKSSHSE